MTWLESRFAARQARMVAEHAYAAEANKVWVTTLATATMPIDQLGMIYGEPADDIQGAMFNLQKRAYEAQCDAVIGATFIALVSGTQYGTSSKLVGYGTAARWRPEAT